MFLITSFLPIEYYNNAPFFTCGLKKYPSNQPSLLSMLTFSRSFLSNLSCDVQFSIFMDHKTMSVIIVKVITSSVEISIIENGAFGKGKIGYKERAFGKGNVHIKCHALALTLAGSTLSSYFP